MKDMKSKPLTFAILFLSVTLSVFLVSGCTAFDAFKSDVGNAIPKTTTYEIQEIPFPTGATSVNAGFCLAEFSQYYPDINQANVNCEVKSADMAAKVYSCLCSVHTGVI